MPITYKVKSKHNVLGGKDEIKYYAVPARFRTVSTEEISRILENSKSMEKSEVQATIGAITELIKEELSLGNSVNIEGLGTFSLSISSEGVPSPEEMTDKKVFAKKICFKPSPKLKSFMKSVVFKPSRKS